MIYLILNSRSNNQESWKAKYILASEDELHQLFVSSQNTM